MSAQELSDKYQEDLLTLQQTCKHEEISDWMLEFWAPGHSTGRVVKACNNCWKTLEINQGFPEVDDTVETLNEEIKNKIIN